VVVARSRYEHKSLKTDADDEHRDFGVAVKNGKRPEGSKTDWAYYDFDKPTRATASAFRDAACYDCRLKHPCVME
jgi:hypothetical protein